MTGAIVLTLLALCGAAAYVLVQRRAQRLPLVQPILLDDALDGDLGHLLHDLRDATPRPADYRALSRELIRLASDRLAGASPESQAEAIARFRRRLWEPTGGSPA